jgi:hypothetical protein
MKGDYQDLDTTVHLPKPPSTPSVEAHCTMNSNSSHACNPLEDFRVVVTRRKRPRGVGPNE